MKKEEVKKVTIMCSGNQQLNILVPALSAKRIAEDIMKEVIAGRRIFLCINDYIKEVDNACPMFIRTDSIVGIIVAPLPKQGQIVVPNGGIMPKLAN